MFAKRIKGIEPSGIRRILEMAATVQDPVDLSIGQPDFDVPDRIKRVAIDAIEQGFNRYSPSAGIPALRTAILKSLQRRGIESESVMVTAGAAGAMTLFFLGLVEEGDEVALTDPWFLNYRHLVTLTGSVPRYIDTYPDFRLREEALDAAIGPRTRMIIINSPGNPTGLLHTREEIEMVVDRARRHDCWIVSDEVYHSFVYDGEQYFSPGMFYEKTLLVDSFSKSAGMPGWRIGYGAGPREVIDELIPLQQYLYSCAPTPAQKAALLCVDRDLEADVRRLQQKRDLVYSGLRDHYEVERPNGAFYIFPKAPGQDCYKFIEKALASNLFVSPGDTFSRRKSHFRISYAVPEAKLIRAIEILRRLAD